MSKSPDNVTQTTTSAPPSYLEPYLRQAAGYAQQLFQSGPQQYYPGNTVVPFSPQTNQALNMQQNRAINGSPLVNQAQTSMQNLMAGNSPLSAFLGGSASFGAAATPGNPAPVNPATGQYDTLPAGSPYAPGGVLSGFGYNPNRDAPQFTLPTTDGGKAGALQNLGHAIGRTDAPVASSGGGVPNTMPRSSAPVVQQAMSGPTGANALGNLSNPQTGPVGDSALSPFIAGMGSGNTGASALSPLTSQGTIGGAGGSNLLATASGDFLNSNPYLDATFDRAAGAVNRNLDTVLARSGRDLTGNIGARADALGNLANDIYGSNFQAERNRQLQAAGQLSSQGAGALGQLAGQAFSGSQNDLSRQLQAAGQLSGQQFGAGQNALNRQAQQQSQLSSQIFGGGQNALDRQLSAAGQIGQQQLAAAGQAIPLAREDYFDIGQLGQVGAAVEQQAGNIQNDYMNRFNFAQGAPYESLNSFIGALSGAPYGGSQSSTQPVFRNPLSSALGGALGGASLANMLGFAGPWGALAGGAIGLLGG